MATKPGTGTVLRQRFPRGRILACRDRDEAIEWLESRDPKRIHDHVRADSASLVFMFPGGGAHYPNMARGLYETEPVFRDVIDRGVRILADRIGVDFFEFFLAEEKEEEQVAAKFLRMSHQLPAIFLVEYGLAELWLSRGVKPSALIGHSVGENAAACVAGVLSFEDALSLVLLRGQLFEKVSGGGMLAVGLPPEEIEGRLPPELELAAVNAPELSVVSGPDDAISTLEKRLEAEELFPQRLAIPVAAHSRMLEPILDEFRGFLEAIIHNLLISTAPGSLHYLFMDWRHLCVLQEVCDRLYGPQVNLCVWVKTNGGMGSFYRSRHELVVIYKNGSAPHVNNVQLGQYGRNRTNVWEYEGANSLSPKRRADLALHPTVKPVEMIADAIRDASNRGDLILDPFLGSGTTVIACEQTGRTCAGMELDPKYVDVIVRRWESFTGGEARHAGTGLTFREMADHRSGNVLMLPAPSQGGEA